MGIAPLLNSTNHWSNLVVDRCFRGPSNSLHSYNSLASGEVHGKRDTLGSSKRYRVGPFCTLYYSGIPWRDFCSFFNPRPPWGNFGWAERKPRPVPEVEFRNFHIKPSHKNKTPTFFLKLNDIRCLLPPPVSTHCLCGFLRQSHSCCRRGYHRRGKWREGTNKDSVEWDRLPRSWASLRE